MTKLDILCKLSLLGTKSLRLLNNTEIDINKLKKLKKAELEQLLESYEVMINTISKCLVEKKIER